MKTHTDQQSANSTTPLDNIREEQRELVQMGARLDLFYAELAVKARQLHPDLFDENPEAAIRFALKHIRETRRACDKIAREQERKARLEQTKSVRVSFIRAAQLITGEIKGRARAEEKFLRYLRATKTEPPSYYQQHVFTWPELVAEYRAFKQWWAKEKSGQAAKARKRVKKPGRVKRRKSDLRFTENRRHRAGYCQTCGKSIRDSYGFVLPGLRICNDCITSNVLAFGASTQEDLVNYGDFKNDSGSADLRNAPNPDFIFFDDHEDPDYDPEIG